MTNTYDPRAPHQVEDPAQQPQPQEQPRGGSPYDGMIAENAQGHRVVWRSSPSGRGGRWVALNAASADARSRERYADLQNRRDVGRRTLSLAEDFIDINRDQRTGGAADRLQLVTGIQAADFAVPWSDPETLPRLQRMRQISRRIVGANWVPGTSGQMNTAAEQENIAQRYMTPGTRGPANLDMYYDMYEDVAEQEAAVRHMEEWLRRHPTLDGWDDAWRQIAPQIRQQARQEARARYAAGFDQQPSSDWGDEITRTYNPRTGRLE